MGNLKINNEIYECRSSHCQLSIDDKAEIYISFDISKNQNYIKKIISLYENSIRFDIKSFEFCSKNNYIKIIDISENYLSIQVRAESFELIRKDERRDNIINDLLNNNE